MHRSEGYSSISFYIYIPQCNHYPDQDLEHSVTSECLLCSSLEVQWLVLYASTAGDEGSVPGQGTKILHAMLCCKKRERERENKKMSTLVPHSSQSLPHRGHGYSAFYHQRLILPVLKLHRGGITGCDLQDLFTDVWPLSVHNILILIHVVECIT